MARPFNDTTNNTGLIQGCESKCFGSNYGAISGNTKRLKTFTRYINNGLDRFSMIVAESDGRWQFHDFNLSTHPVAVATLVAGQTDYALAEIHQEVKHVYVKDSGGVYRTLKPLDERDIAGTGVSPEDFLSTDGMPQYYDLKGHSVFLYPAPSADSTTLDSGLKLSYVESPSYFATSDTTQSAGINPLFQSYPELYASHEYFMDNQMEKKERMFAEKLAIMEMEIRDYYSTRDNDDRPTLRPRRRNYV